MVMPRWKHTCGPYIEQLEWDHLVYVDIYAGYLSLILVLPKSYIKFLSTLALDIT